MKRKQKPKLLEHLAEKIHERLQKSRLSYLLFPKSIQQDMQVLGRSEKDYYVKKLVYVCGFSVGGIVLAAVYAVWHFHSSRIPVTEVDRPEPYEGREEITIQAGRYDERYHFMLEPRLLTAEEAEQQLEELLASWESLILGENESLEQIRSNLVLPEYIEGYPFEIYWESDQEQVIDPMGTVNRQGLKEDCIVMLTAVIYYQDFMWMEQFGVLVLREELSEEERYKRELGVFLEDSEETQRTERVWSLPDSFEEEHVEYQRVQDDYEFLLLALLMPFVGVAIWFGQDQDLHSIRSKRQAFFQSEYISFAGSLSLYISAGLNLQLAMQFCMEDYVRRKPPDNLLRIGLCEFQKDIQNGRSFSEALERFAVFTDDMNYRKLAGFFSQGMINGTGGLAVTLEQEVDKTREEKRRHCKIAGEQVSTKLIAPMMLQLGIVIALIMIPAFIGMDF